MLRANFSQSILLDMAGRKEEELRNVLIQKVQENFTFPPA